MDTFERTMERIKKLREERTPHNTVGGLTRGVKEPEHKKRNAGRERTDKRGQKGQREAMGLVSTWSHVFGYVAIHDPTTGEWHDLKTEDAPDWAKREAFKRKELYRDGNRKAFRLTAREMEEIWESERVPELEGIVEDHPIEEEDREC